jgi:hypothetical protein
MSSRLGVEQIIAEIRQTAEPGPGNASTSRACIGSPQWPQRRSTLLI